LANHYLSVIAASRKFENDGTAIFLLLIKERVGIILPSENKPNNP
jgi:hypothetical protein